MPELATLLRRTICLVATCTIAADLSAPRAVGAADEIAAPNVMSDDVKLLFNHKDLTGWRQPAENGWKVVDGALQCRATMTEDPFILTYDEKLPADFALRFSWREAPGQDTDFPDGMFLLLTAGKEFVDGPPDAPKSRQRLTSIITYCAGGNLVQIRTLPIVVDELPDDFRSGAFSRESAVPSSRRRPGEWNHAEIIVRGATIEYKLNDRAIQSIDLQDAEVRKETERFAPLAEHWLTRKRSGFTLSISPVGSEANYRDFQLRKLSVVKP